VRALQVALGQHSSRNVAVDGGFGTGTDRAIRAFQSARGLSADGVVGPMTWLNLVGSCTTGRATQPHPTLRSPSLPLSTLPLVPRATSCGEPVTLSSLSPANSHDASTLQYLLRNVVGPSVAVTGALDNATTVAVINMQRSRGLADSGSVDLATWRVLWRTVSVGVQGSSVLALMQQLVKHGFGVDVNQETYTIEDAEIVAEFQQDRALLVDGIAGPQTWAALLSLDCPSLAPAVTFEEAKASAVAHGAKLGLMYSYDDYMTVFAGTEPSAETLCSIARCGVASGVTFIAIEAGLMDGTPNPALRPLTEAAKCGGFDTVDTYIYPDWNNTNASNPHAEALLSSLASADWATFATVWIAVDGSNLITSSAYDNQAKLLSLRKSIEAAGFKPGVFTSATQWDGLTNPALQNVTAFHNTSVPATEFTALSDLPLWYGDLDGTMVNTDLTSDPFGGWTSAVFKLFTTNARTSCGVSVRLMAGSSVPPLPDKDDGSNKMKPVVLAAIVVGCVVFAAIVFALAIVMLRRRRHNSPDDVELADRTGDAQL